MRGDNMFYDLFSFYRSKEWESLRRQITLERVNDSGDLICEYCHKPIVNAYEGICHHKTELNEGNVNDYNISLNPDNIMVVHHKCHNEIHNRFGSYTRHIYIVYGSPCAGKSTYVKENATKHDIIVDVNALYKAIGVSDKSNRLTSNVLQLRDVLIDMIRTRNGRWINAWVITSKCRPTELERMSNMLGAEIIHIDTDMDTCLRRANENDVKYITEYFRDYEQYKDLLNPPFKSNG